MGERRPYKPEVAGSIPVPPTIRESVPTISREGRPIQSLFRLPKDGRSSRVNHGIPPTIRVAKGDANYEC